MGRTGGEYKEGFQALGACPGLDAFEQYIASRAVAVLRVHCQARQLPRIRIRDLIQRRAGDDHAFALDHAELFDLTLQHFPRTAHQNALLFQRADQVQQAADVFNRRFAHQFELLLGHQRTAAVAGKQLGEQGAIFGVADDMAAPYSTPAGFGSGIEQFGLIVAAQALQVRGYLLWAQFTHQAAVLIDQTGIGAEQQQFVGAQIDGGAGGDVFAGQVEDLAGGRIPQRRQQHDRALIQQAVDALAVDPAHFAGVVVVHAFKHADWPCGDQVAAGHAQARALHRRGRHVHGQARLDGNTQMAHRVDHTLQRRSIGDAQAFVVSRGKAACLKAGFDLRARAMHQHQAHTQAVKQHQVVDDIAEVGVVHTIAGQHDHKGAVAVGVDVGRSVTKPIDVFGHNTWACNKKQPNKGSIVKAHSG